MTSTPSPGNPGATELLRDEGFWEGVAAFAVATNALLFNNLVCGGRALATVEEPLAKSYFEEADVAAFPLLIHLYTHGDSFPSTYPLDWFTTP
jgi:hypothetical protein